METPTTSGNTNSEVVLPARVSKKKEKRPNQLKRWCFTFNNYTESELGEMETRFRELKIKGIIGREVAESGTPHLQGYIECPQPMRWTEFKLNKEIHWEKTREDRATNIKYCSKENNVSWLTLPVPRPDLAILNFSDLDLYQWQTNLYEIHKTEPDRRTIYWIYDQTGNKGKSFFCKWMITQFPEICVLVNCTRSADILTNATEYAKTYLIDIPRSTGPDFAPFNAIEQLKNGFVCDSKLKANTRVVNVAPPHIFVFSNNMCPVNVMSADRIKLIQL
nr:MAG: replication associated protein [Cressdnaviricota sp.]